MDPRLISSLLYNPLFPRIYGIPWLLGGLPPIAHLITPIIPPNFGHIVPPISPIIPVI